MAKGKIHHWKHGWIPLDAFARAQLAGRKKSLPLTVDEKRAELDKRRLARGEAPLPPRKRKPANFVPAKDNIATWKAPSTEELKRTTKKVLDDDRAKAKARPKPDWSGVQKAQMDAVRVNKNSAGVFHVQDSRDGRVLMRTLDPVVAMDWLIKNGMDPKDAKAHVRTAQSAADIRRERYRKVTTVDGVDFVSYKSSAMDPLGTDHGEPWEMDEAQMQVVADAYNEVKAQFPGMEPVQIVATQNKEGVLGITAWDGRRISLLKNAFSDKERATARRNFGDHGAIAGQFADDPEAFARAVVVHELGHALEMQRAEARRRGDQLALELVGPADLGLDTTGWDPAAINDRAMRWMNDTLGGQSVYATGNQFEWFAEAFADGWFNGDKATSQGKRALGILKDIYGKAAA